MESWQVSYTGLNGKRRVDGTYRRESDANQALARTLKNLDGDIQDGLPQLLMTPNARKRAGVVVEAEVPKRNALELMRALQTVPEARRVELDPGQTLTWRDIEISDEPPR